jgi:Glucanosyltransferase
MKEVLFWYLRRQLWRTWRTISQNTQLAKSELDIVLHFQCTTTGDSNDPSRVNLSALNSYSWCNGDNIQTSTYNVLASDLANTSVPVFFSEYGCNRVTPRTFDEAQAIYGPVMIPSLSGGVVYEFTEGVNNYGLVVLNSKAQPNFARTSPTCKANSRS